jgi:WD40 repeat protein
MWSVKDQSSEDLKFEVPFNGVPVSVSFNPTNAGQCVYGMMDDLSASVCCVDLSTKQSLGSHRFTDGSGDARERMYIYQIAPHPKHDNTVISSHEDGRLRLTDFRSGKCEAEIIVSNDDAASCVGISSGGEHLYAGSHNGTVRVFSLAERKMVQDITSAHFKHFDESVNAICYGDSTLVTAGSDAVINVYRHVQLK